MISSIDLSFLKISCMITWFTHSFIHSFLLSFLFVHSSYHLFVYSFINYTITVKNMMYISSSYSSPPFDKKANKQKHQKKKKTQGSDTVLVAWNPVPCTVPVRWWIPPPVRVTPSSPGGQSPYHWAGNALDLSCTSQWTYS